MHRLVVIFIIFFLVGCDLNKVQEEPPIIKLANNQLSSSPFLADNNTKIVLELNLGDPDIARKEVVVITTTHGSLFPLNTYDFTMENRELTLNPVERETMFILRTGLIPGEAFVTATVDKMVGYDTVRIHPAIAESIELSAPKSEVSLASGETLILTALLSRQGGAVSTGQMVSFSLNNNAIANIPSNASSDDQGVALVTLVPVTTGTVIVTVSVGSVTDSITITIN